MPTIIIKNTTTETHLIKELGQVVDPLEEVDLSDYAFPKIASSGTLKSLVQDGTFVVNDGTDDLSVSDGLDHINIESEYEDDQTPDGPVSDEWATKEYAAAMAIILG